MASYEIQEPNGSTYTGYWIVGADGGVFALPQNDSRTPFYGSIPALGNVCLNAPIVAILAMPDGTGYDLIGADGGIFKFGNAYYPANFSPPPLTGNPIVGAAFNPAGTGITEVSSTGQIYNYNTPYLGGSPNLVLGNTVVSISESTAGNGDYMLTTDGGMVYSYPDGQGPDYGGLSGYVGQPNLGGPPAAITSVAETPTDSGYWMTDADGDIYAFNVNDFGVDGNHIDAAEYGAAAPVVGMATGFSDDDGYWQVSYDGNVYAFGVQYGGNAPNLPPPPTSTEDQTGGDSNPVTNYQPPCGADPVNCATGNFWQTYTDYSNNDPGPGLDFTRTYNSQDSLEGGIFGYGWSTSYAMSVDFDQNNDTATVIEATGSTVTFDETDNGIFAAPPGILATLTENADGSWTFVLRNADTFQFNSLGELTEITDLSGLSTTLSYSNNLLSAVTDSEGKTITLNYQSNSSSISPAEVVSSITLPGGKTIHYSYTPQLFLYGYLDSISTVTDPGASQTSFGYEFGARMTSITKPDGGVTTNTYDDTEEENLDMPTGTIATQISPDGGETSWSFSGNNSTSGTTTITNPNGSITTENFTNGQMTSATTSTNTSLADTSNYQYDPNTLGVTQTQNANLPPTQQVYNSSGDETLSTDALGNSTQYAYNSANQEWCEVDPADYLNGTRCPVSEPSSPPAPGAADPYLGMALKFYDGSGQLAATTDALGNTTLFAYTTTSSGPNVPQELQYCSVDAVAYQKGVLCPAYGAAHVVGTTMQTFDVNGNVLTSTDANGNVTTNTYGVPGFPNSAATTTDPDGDETTFSYSNGGLVTSQTVTYSGNGYSATTLYAYTPEGQKYCEVQPLEAARGISCPTTDPTSPPTGEPGYSLTIYNAADQVVYTTTPIGGTTQYAYDSTGNKVSAVSAFNYSQGDRCPSTSSGPLQVPTVGNDPYLGATIYTFDSDNRLVQETNPLGGITLDVYDQVGNLEQTTVESNGSARSPNVVTTDDYNADGQVTQRTVDPGSSSAATTLSYYDPNGSAYCSVSADATAGSSYFCPPWQPSWIVIPPNPQSEYSAPPTTIAAKDVTLTFRNADQEQVQSSNAVASTTISAFDGDGRAYCTEDATNLGSWIASNPSSIYPYNCPVSAPAVPPTAGSNPGYDISIYDADGNVLASSNADGDTTTKTYDPAGNVLTTNNGLSVTTNCYYWETSTCAASAPSSGGSGSMLYSTLLPATSSDPTGEFTTYTYLAGGLQRSSTTPAGVKTTGYDAAGNVRHIDYSNPASGFSSPADVTYTYNPDGSRETMSDGTGTTSYTYDANGDTTSQDLVAASGTSLSNSDVSYGYFPNGDRSSITYPSYSGSANPQVKYSYDATGTMASETDWQGNEVGFSHDADGNETSQANGVSTVNPAGTSSTAFTYNPADELASTSSTLAQTCGSDETLTQAFSGSTGSINPDGLLTSYDSSYAGSCTDQSGIYRTYSYDPEGEVTHQQVGTIFGYSDSYNQAGEATTFSAIGQNDNATYSQTFNSGGQLTSQNITDGFIGQSSQYSYDAIGDQTQSLNGSGNEINGLYGYNSAGQMTSATTPSADTSYLYTGDGLEASTNSTTIPWSNSHVDGKAVLDAVSCPSANFCAAVDADGGGLLYQNGSWPNPQKATSIDGTSTLKDISCSSNSFCAATDNAGNVVVYDDGIWEAPQAVDAAGHSMPGISCWSDGNCVAVDTAGNAYVDSNGTWSGSAHSVDNVKLVGVSCPSSSLCVAIDKTGNAVTFDPTAYVGATSASIDSNPLTSISCVSNTACVAVDDAGGAVVFNGTWSAPSTVSAYSLSSVSCTSSISCVAVDADGNSWTYSGAAWSSVSIDSTTELDSVSCSSSTFCTAIDAQGNAITLNGSSWSTTHVDGQTVTEAVSCPTTTLCIAVDATGDGLTYSGSSWSGGSWSQQAGIDGSNTLEAISCSSASYCAAVDSVGKVVTFKGTAVGWGSTAQDIDGTRVLLAVSCWSDANCVAVDKHGGEVYEHNGTWAASPVQIDGTKQLTGVSCESATTCVAVDNDGNAITFNPSSGTSGSPVSIDSGFGLTGISCTSSTLCIAIDDFGNEVTYNGTSWVLSSIDDRYSLTSIGCAGASSCVATDSVGNIVTFNGSDWLATRPIESVTTALDGVTCASASDCMAVDDQGNALQEQAPAQTSSQLTWDTAGSLESILSDGVNDYIYGPTGEPVEQINITPSPPPNNPIFMTYTSADGTWLTTNSAGDQLAYWSYDAYGAGTIGTPDSPFGFGGQYTDVTGGTSLINLRARWYQPQSGEFTTQDPGLAETDQPYTYADDDPVNETDPSGLWTHGYCLSESLSSFDSESDGNRYLSENAMACLEDDGYGNVALLTSASFVNQDASSANAIVTDYLNTGVQSGGVNAYAFNTNSNTVFGGINGNWQTAGGGVALQGLLGISGYVFYNPATNGSGYLYGVGVGASQLGTLPISFGFGSIDLNSYPIQGGLGNVAKSAIQAIDGLSTFLPFLPFFGEGGAPSWLLSFLSLPIGFQEEPGPIGKPQPTTEAGTITCGGGGPPVDVV